MLKKLFCFVVTSNQSWDTNIMIIFLSALLEKANWLKYLLSSSIFLVLFKCSIINHLTRNNDFQIQLFMMPCKVILRKPSMHGNFIHVRDKFYKRLSLDCGETDVWARPGFVSCC